MHYNQLRSTPALFAKIADPVANPAVLKLKRQLTNGICVIVEDGVGCNKATRHPRRVCLSHLRALTRLGKLAELTDSFVERRYTFGKRTPDQIVPGLCILAVDGKPCSNPARRRGLCNACIHAIGKQKLSFEDYALPVQSPQRSLCVLSRRPRLTKSICMAAVNGELCHGIPHARGLCKLHYKMAKRQRMLEEIALSGAELDGLPDLPQFYLDKNIVIRFAMYENFGVKPERSSIDLVDAVLTAKAVGTVSVDCVRSVYSHLGHRLARSAAEGGKGLDEKSAEQNARKYTGQLFFGRDGLWRFIAFTDTDLCACTRKAQFMHLSLEDALEMRLYARAKMDCLRMLFVTADGGILGQTEAVHPMQAAKALMDVSGHSK